MIGSSGTRSRTTRRPPVAALVAAPLAVLLFLASGGRAAAHPLGNFTVNQYSRIELGPSDLRLVYVLDLAELPTVQDRDRVDPNGDGRITAAEENGYLDAKIAEILPMLHLSNGTPELPLTLVGRSLAFLDGQGGLKTTRLEATFVADVTTPEGVRLQFDYRNDYAVDRVGWREIVVANGAGIRLEASDAPSVDRSQALRVYPTDPLSLRPDQRSARFAFRAEAGAPAAPSLAAGATAAAAPDPVAALIAGGAPGGLGMLAVLVAAAGWGAMHSLSPGHGKTLVGAYLVGARGTPRHALFLGLTVTATHTAGVIALGLIVLFASRTVAPERLFPWLSLLSGVMVVVLGSTILRSRLRGRAGHHAHAHAGGHDHGPGHDHDHHHDHAHAGPALSHLPPGADGSAITWRSLVALGVSGGLLPCPSALLALLGAIALGRAGLGLLIVLAFSAGLAATLSGIGLVFLFAGRLLERRLEARPVRFLAPVVRFAPILGAAAVTLTGVVLVVRALAEVRLL